MNTNCKSCGATLPEGAIMCPACGKPAQEPATTPVAEAAPIPSAPSMASAPVAEPAPTFGSTPAPTAPTAAPTYGAAAPADNTAPPVAPVAPGAAPVAPYGQAPQAPMGQQPYGQAPMMNSQQPYGQAPMGQQPYGQAPGMPGMPVPGMQTPYPIAKTTPGQAIAAIILGIASLLVAWNWSAFYGLGMAVVGIILSATTMSKFDPTTQKGKGLAIAGLVFSIFTVLLFLWWFFFL